MSITIRYFPCRGRVEPLRLIFVEAGVSWKENPLTDFSKWAEEKKTTPFGSLPIVTVGDQKYTQTMAIIRHFAHKYEFMGKTEQERIRTDIMTEAVLDAQEKLASKYYWNANWETDKRDVEEKLLPPTYSNLQQHFKGDGNSGPYVLGDSISVGDFMLWCFLDLMKPFVPEALGNYSDLNKFYQDFSSRERISAYLHSDKRFKTHTVPLSPIGGTPESSSQP